MLRAATEIKGWVDRLGEIWIEGEVSNLSLRAGNQMSFLTLRDLTENAALPVACFGSVVKAMSSPPKEGDRLVILGKPSFYVPSGRLSITATAMRAVGIGELLARIEVLKKILDGEGLFAESRKKPLPFLPRAVGLITGANSDAERDVLENARRRWPAVRFEVRNTAVQGPKTVPEVIAALTDLQRNPEVEVIVIARGGGSVEDLLPFSDEALVRAVADCSVPVVSAIGHEADQPLLDFVADLRASTPTDAAARIVPDIQAELRTIADHLSKTRAVVTRLVREAGSWLRDMRSRPVLASPDGFLIVRQEQWAGLVLRMRTHIAHALERARLEVDNLRSSVHLLSPASTLDRGYAIVQRADGTVVQQAAHLTAQEVLSVRVASGSFTATVEQITDTGSDPEGA